MKLISAWFLIFSVLSIVLGKRINAYNRLEGEKSVTILRSFGLRPIYYSNSELLMTTETDRRKNEQMKKEAIVREKLEEKFRQIINERLMPLTRGYSFMRDFYSGRY
jgi:hypothetical protein